MFSKKVQDAMNDQIQRELESAHIYLSMAAYFDSENLPGFAHWMNVQFHEEQAHAFKFYNFVNDRGGQVVLQAIGQPPVKFQSPLAVFEKALAHEEKITGHINDLYALATEENDFASQSLLQWFIDEQVEEEKNAGDIVDTLKKVGDNYQALLMIDRELSQRQLPAEAGNDAAAS
ncbi:MAG: ferritin [Fidelibacterota bacterium]|nr:MAG: ferritin [Candidatus Neomarinimicrobiota bacterium]